MTKIELAKELAVSEKLHLSTAVQAIDGVIRILKETLQNGEAITIRGFGTIAPIDMKERKAHNFKTGKSINIAAHRSARLYPSKELVKTMNEGKEVNDVV